MKRSLVLVGLGVLLGFAGLQFCTAAKRAPVPAPAPRADLLPRERTTIALFKKAAPSVVYITSIVRRRDVWSFNIYEIPQGAGSGFVWDDQGHIVTNFHVIQNAERAEVTLADQTSWVAKPVGVAPDKDLAVIKIDAPKELLKPLAIGTSNDLQVGQDVIAIGNPFGLDQTLTKGVISALGREITSLTRRPITGVVQTDAAINPGNSGGPLLDSSGRVIGVNTQIYSPSGAFAGVGFAVPVDTVRRIVPQLIKYGRAIRAGLGVSIAEDYLARQVGVRGVLILDVPRRSAAARAGLRGTRRGIGGRPEIGDVIVAVEDKTVETLNDLYKALDPHSVGDTVSVTVLREGEELQFRIELQALN
jgi:S1-C subfamily serine protease